MLNKLVYPQLHKVLLRGFIFLTNYYFLLIQSSLLSVLSSQMQIKTIAKITLFSFIYLSVPRDKAMLYSDIFIPDHLSPLCDD